jgi:hypothetical protein
MNSYDDFTLWPTDESFCEDYEESVDDLPEIEVLRRIHAKDSVSSFDTKSQHIPYFSLMHTMHSLPHVRPLRPTT